MSLRVNRQPFLAIRAVLRALLVVPARWQWGFSVVHGERLPRSRRPLILACNHAALIDTVFLILAVRPRFTVCGAKPPYFRTVLRRVLMAVANIIRVDGREGFLTDCRRLLDAGEILLIYPEMGRNSRGLGEFSIWPAEVALASDVPVLPCYLEGTGEEDGGDVRLIVGQEIPARGDAAELTASMRRAITGLATRGGAS